VNEAKFLRSVCVQLCGSKPKHH